MCKLLLFFSLLFILSCKNGQHHELKTTGPRKAVEYPVAKTSAGVRDTLKDSFADSTTIGRKGLDKVEIACYTNADSTYVITRFYAKRGRAWLLRNKFKFHQDEYLNPLADISDLNGDGFNDVTYSSLQAGNMANDVRKLFVYEPRGDSLVYIKNSEAYPNIQYNRDLHCIDAFLVSGGCSTVFLKLEKDTLRQFASVDLGEEGLSVSVYDRKGKEKVILKKKANRAIHIRYKNYRPLEEADE